MAAVIIRSGKLFLLKTPTKLLIPQVMGNVCVLVPQSFLAFASNCQDECANLEFSESKLVACDLVLQNLLLVRLCRFSLSF